MDWWPDWAGETVVIVASGPSATKAPLDMARGRAKVVTINRSWELAPWADMAYGCDWQWWAGDRSPRPEEFAGLRVCGAMPSDGEKAAYTTEAQRAFLAGLTRLDVRPGTGPAIWEGPQVRGGSMSAFQIANLAARCGARRIALVGVDCDGPNSRWHGRHDHNNAPTQDAANVRRWIAQWRETAPDFVAHGVEVVNCSSTSRLDCFVKMPLAAALPKIAA